MKAIDEVVWGIIGCGKVTEVKSGPAFNKVPNSKLAAVMRRDEAAARDYAKRHKVGTWTTSAEELLANDEINAVYIATPPDTHALYAEAAARAGKVVYVEKPMARSYEESLHMIDVCRRYKVPLFVAYYRRALPRFETIRENIGGGWIGTVRFVNTVFQRQLSDRDSLPENWRVKPEIAGCGYFCDLTSHHLDLLQHLLGQVRKARGLADRQAGAYDAEDAVSYHLLMENKVQVTGVWNFASYTNRDETVIVGDRGEVRFSTFADNPVIVDTIDGHEELNIPHPKHIQQPLIEKIVNSVLSGQKLCPSTGTTAAETSRLMDAILDRRVW